MLWQAYALAQPASDDSDSADRTDDTSWDLSASGLTEEEWRNRVAAARARSQKFVESARRGTAQPITSRDEELRMADERTMKDHSLRRGDIISTSRGFFIFVGREDRKRQPGDFVPVPEVSNHSGRSQ